MKRKWGRWISIITILLLGTLMILWIILEPQRTKVFTEGHSTHSVRKIMADLRYDRRIELIREELDIAEEDQYQHLFLSMYPIRSYDTYYFSYWRGLDIFKTEMVMENGRELAGTLEYLQNLDILPETIFLGLDPEMIEAEYPLEDSLLQMIRQTPQTSYEILIVNPRMEYWREKEDGQWQAILDQYERAITLLVQEENVKVFYACDKEWLVCNDSNYTEEKMPAEDVATMLLAYYIRGEYQLTVENLAERMAATEELIADWRKEDRKLDGLKDKTLVFMGDSTFGNFDGSLAITGIVEEFTGAQVINCGYGGMAAAYGDTELPAFGDLLQAVEKEDGSGLLRGETGPPAVQTSAELKKIAGRGDNMVIFLVYGINDYIKGFPISSADPYDRNTYEGALRAGIESLQDMFPGAEMVLMTPNFIKYNQYGRNPVGEADQVYADYVQAIHELAEEFDLPLLDNYGEMNINKENVSDYLQDEVHLNEGGRFMVAMRMLEQLKQLYP